MKIALRKIKLNANIIIQNFKVLSKKAKKGKLFIFIFNCLHFIRIKFTLYKS
jgi:hypothetical protein